MRPNQITQSLGLSRFRYATLRSATQPGGLRIETIIGCAIEVHRHLGPGLLERAYEVALCRELYLNGVSYQRLKRLPLHYKGIDLGLSYRIDIVVSEVVVVEIKAVDKVMPIHEAQLLTYLKLGGYQIGLLLNFNRWRPVVWNR